MMGDFRNSPTGGSSPFGTGFDDSFGDEFGFGGQGARNGQGSQSRPRNDQGDTPPAWSELKTKAGKDRKRLPLACIACRRKKIRCSGEKPSCKHCLRARIPCVYKVTTRKAAPRTDYMAMLDKRLKRMEERIIKVMYKPDQDATDAVTRAVVKPALPGSQSQSKPGIRKRGAGEISASDLTAWAQMGPKGKASEGVDRLLIPSQETEESELFRDGADALPSKQMQEYLAEVFFDSIYGQVYHLLHKPSYMRKLKSDSLPPVLVLCVCAVSARFAICPQFQPSARQFLRGEEWAKPARDIVMRRYDWPNLTILTCLLILGLHEFGTCQGGRSWALAGHAIRMAFALQLHKDLEYDPMSRGQARLSFIDREIRRRLMWSCFLSDRLISSGTDRPIFIREDTVKVPLPVKERYFQLDMPAPTETLDGKRLHSTCEETQHLAQAENNMGVAAYMIRTMALFGRIVSYVNQGGRDNDPFNVYEEESEFTKLVGQADSFMDTLPDSLHYSAENLKVHQTENIGNSFLLLHITIQQNILFLNRAGLTLADAAPRNQATADFVTRASTKTFAAANRVTEILRDAETAQCPITAPFVGFCAFSSTTVHILGIFSGNVAMKKVSEVCAGINIKYMRKMMRYWGTFHWMVETIRTQFRRATEAAKAGKTANLADASVWALQYGDWFDHYPHGVSEADVKSPATKDEADGKVSAAVLEQKPEMQSVEEYVSSLYDERSSSTQSSRGSSAKRRATGNRGGATQGGSQGRSSRDPSAQPTQAQPPAPGLPEANLPPAKPSRRSSTKSEAINVVTSRNFPMARTSMDPPYSMSPANAHFKDFRPAHNQATHLFQQDMLSASLGAPSHVMPQQQQQGQQHVQQSAFDGYGMAPHHSSEVMGQSAAGWGHALHPTGGGSAAPPEQAVAMDFSMEAPSQQHHSTVMHGHAIMPPGMLSDYNDQNPSLAWFMPFNVEPPEIGMDPNQGDLQGPEYMPSITGDGDAGTLVPGMFSVGMR